MPERAWQDMIVGDRMEVDQDFEERIRQSQFSRQEWSLIMTAIELEIEGSGEDARLVADTSQVEAILPELDRMKSENPMMGSESSGGFLDSLKSSLGLGGGVDQGTLDEAEALATDYATALQEHLEENGKWTLVRGRD